ncbi:hypothetical protein KY330_05715 [Candidatus Woesearchaeota archaeon]|nr:hypothetical protein [Candidatus Woesearchaeota archaeon]
MAKDKTQDEDLAVLDKIQEKKKQRPHIAKLLSRKDLDDFELDVLMSTDESSISDMEGFDFDTFDEFE